MIDIIIIGGGIIGMLTARELHLSGARVALFDQGPLGGESSWAGGGILSPLYPWRYADAINQLAQQGHSLYPGLAAELLSESGIDPEYIHSGLLVLDVDQRSRAEAWAKRWGYTLKSVDAGSIHQLDPQLSGEFREGMWMPDIGQLRNPRLVKSMKGVMQHYTIETHPGTRVERLIIENQQVRGVVAGGQNYHASRVVVAGGAWSAQLFPGAPAAPGIEPVKGQMVLFRAPQGLLNSIVLYQGHYLIPRRDGRILAGSTLEYTGFDKQLSTDARDTLRKAAVGILPQLAQYEIEHHWAGLRPGTPEGVPYICEHPEIQGLYINAGHFRNGVILGIASVKLLVQIIEGRADMTAIEAYGFDAPH